jgi:hypothetical protein
MMFVRQRGSKNRYRIGDDNGWVNLPRALVINNQRWVPESMSSAISRNLQLHEGIDGAKNALWEGVMWGSMSDRFCLNLDSGVNTSSRGSSHYFPTIAWLV